MKRKIYNPAMVLFVFFNVNFLYSQSLQPVPFDSDNWIFDAAEHSIAEHMGRNSLKLKGGHAVVKGSEFLNGIIEFDIAFAEERGFMGVIWRYREEYNYEEFYMRPHQSGNPDANQYQPVFNGVAGWQLYYGERYAAPVKYEYNKWIPVKIVVSGMQADIYVSNMETPILFIDQLKHESSAGKIGLSVGNFAPAFYSNFRYSTVANPQLKGKPREPETTPEGTVKFWSISNTFDEKILETKFIIENGLLSVLKWNPLEAEISGVVNMARVQGIEPGKNTVFARMIIQADEEQIKPLLFGYSDRIKVYLNKELIYSGNNNYLSRDYRYLGTIGLFDEVYLRLNKGSNELLLAVSENFGGWGIIAKFSDLNGN